MRALDSLIIKCADLHKVPAGWALAVDRKPLVKVTSGSSIPLIEIVIEEVTRIEGGPRSLRLVFDFGVDFQP